uniref:Uncharacterized protein n=1 Tax=Aegilops tauschii subsp. strangulata TaxID=200361 RepID=A0A453IXQ2_AEGTS
MKQVLDEKWALRFRHVVPEILKFLVFCKAPVTYFVVAICAVSWILFVVKKNNNSRSSTIEIHLALRW